MDISEYLECLLLGLTAVTNNRVVLIQYCHILFNNERSPHNVPPLSSAPGKDLYGDVGLFYSIPKFIDQPTTYRTDLISKLSTNRMNSIRTVGKRVYVRGFTYGINVNLPRSVIHSRTGVNLIAI